MKKFLFLALSTILLLISCKKEEIPGPDWREAFVGTYQCSGMSYSYYDYTGYESSAVSTTVTVSLRDLDPPYILINDVHMIEIDSTGEYIDWYGTYGSGVGPCPIENFHIDLDLQGNIVYEHGYSSPSGWTNFYYTGTKQ